jgi:hypothetical protein
LAHGAFSEIRGILFSQGWRSQVTVQFGKMRSQTDIHRLAIIVKVICDAARVRIYGSIRNSVALGAQIG